MIGKNENLGCCPKCLIVEKGQMSSIQRILHGTMFGEAILQEPCVLMSGERTRLVVLKPGLEYISSHSNSLVVLKPGLEYISSHSNSLVVLKPGLEYISSHSNRSAKNETPESNHACSCCYYVWHVC